MLVLLGLMAVLKTKIHWPGDTAEATVLLAVMVVSLVPILLAVADIVIERGGAIEYRGVRVDFSKSAGSHVTGFTIPPNIGVPGQPLYDSNSAEILATLRDATRSALAIIDLAGGEAWWETRLLVLLEGADRLGSPEKIVFIATDRGRERQFQGWARAPELLRLLVKADDGYARCVAAARAAAAQWKTVEPPSPGMPPPALPVTAGPLASKSGLMAFDPTTNLPNDLLAEQLLQSELGLLYEAQGLTRPISVTRLEALFRPVLRADAIELTASSQDQIDAALSGQEPDVVITEGGAYRAMTSRVALIGELARSLHGSPQP
jgi:hypothetical protein